jgi:hypothetical protein
MMKTFFTGVFLTLAIYGSSQPSLIWEKTYGGSQLDGGGFRIEVDKKGNYVIPGASRSNDGNISINKGGFDAWVLKIDTAGSILSSRTYGGSNSDEFHGIVMTKDGGSIFAGNSGSTDGDATGSGNHTSMDVWVVKLDSSGNVQWNKCYGNFDGEAGYYIIPTQDTGYLITGHSGSSGGDVTSNYGATDAWVFKIDSLGNKLWDKSFGGGSSDVCRTVAPTQDGGFIVGAYGTSANYDFTGSNGNSEYLIVKLDAAGNMQWKKVFGGIYTELLHAIKQTATGNYIVAGETDSPGGDPGGTNGDTDAWVLMLNDTGGIVWSHTYGGGDLDLAMDIVEDDDGGFILVGYTESSELDSTGFKGVADLWVFKISSTGALMWQKTFGSSGYDKGKKCIRSNNKLLITGSGALADGDVSSLYGGGDLWVLKLKLPVITGVSPVTPHNSTFTVYPNPVSSRSILSYNLPPSARNANCTIYDLQGRVAATFNLPVHQNSIALPSDALGNGVYLCDLVVDGIATPKKKIVVLR